MNPEAQTEFDKILVKLAKKESLTEYESDFLRARRSYLSLWQRLQFSDVLYFKRQFLLQKAKNILVSLSKFAKEIVIAIIVALIVFWLIRL